MQVADLSFPVILAAEGRVMDGMHRIAKALLLGLGDHRRGAVPGDTGTRLPGRHGPTSFHTDLTCHDRRHLSARY